MRKSARRRAVQLLLRAGIVIAGVMTIVSGVSFALLQSQQAVSKSNTIQTAVANVQLSTDGTTYAASLPGFSFVNLIPGGQSSPTNGYPVYLKNAGTTPLAMTLSISNPITNPDNVDLSKVHLILSPMGGGAGQNITLADLVSAATTGGVALTQATRVIPSQSIGYTLQVSMETNAVSGPSASISTVDFSFGAVAVN